MTRPQPTMLSFNLGRHGSAIAPFGALCLVAARLAFAGGADAAALPVREVTVFKDGHALLLRQGVVPTDGRGDVELDDLPAPVLGTFWPFCADDRAALRSTTAGTRTVAVERQAASVLELLDANIGAPIAGFGGTHASPSVILDTPKRPRPGSSTIPAESASADASASIVLLKTPDGTRALPLAALSEVVFLEPPARRMTVAEERNRLVLDLAWRNDQPGDAADVGLLYLQRGIRWIPGYRVDIDGAGRAAVTLQATLVNDMIDLDDVTMHLVVGVPTFRFAETLDPMALQSTIVGLSPYFDRGRTAGAMSRALLTQASRMGEHHGSGDSGGDGPNLDPDAPDAGRNEDLFVFSLEHITLRRGERMVLPVASFVLPYRDVFTLDLPVSPPAEALRCFNGSQQHELARSLRAPKAEHVLRLTNDSAYPLTTAPAMILREGRLLAQGMLSYTAVGATTDLSVTASVDLRYSIDERERGRTPDAAVWRGNRVATIDFDGTITLVNGRTSAATVEVRRFVLGQVKSADHDGTAAMLNPLAGESAFGEAGPPVWWGWYPWPEWWSWFNGVGRFEWTVNVPAGESVALRYAWQLFSDSWVK